MVEDSIGVEVNTVAFEGAMQRLRKGVREGFINPQYGTLTVQAPLLAERCQALTPPYALKNKTTGENTSRAKKAGEVAVIRDLSRIYAPQSPKTYTDKRIRRIVMRDDRDGWRAAARNFPGGLRNTEAIGFSETWHQQNRNNRGRAVRGKYGNLGKVTLGPQGTLARAYIKKVLARVGWAKAGWNMGILAFGGRVAAGWIGRHSIIRGKITDGRLDPEPYVGVTNDTGWAQNNNAEGERIIRNAVNSRIRDMYSYYERMMRLAASKAQKAA